MNSTAMQTVTRELLPGGIVRLISDQATFEFARPRPGRLLVTITGMDKGQFGFLDQCVATPELIKLMRT